MLTKRFPRRKVLYTFAEHIHFASQLYFAQQRKTLLNNVQTGFLTTDWLD